MTHRSWLALGRLLLGHLIASHLLGADSPSHPWKRLIHPQPFDHAPFHEVAIPDWIEETVGVGYTLSGQNTEERARAVAAGVTISEMGFVDPLYPYYDSKLLHKRSPHVPLDRLAKDIAEYKKLGLRILGVYPPSLQGEVYEAHPDWRRVAQNTEEIPQVDLVEHPYGGMLCLLGPYGDFLIDVLVEIVTRFPEVDAFSFDGLHYAGVCYCRHCRENYRRDSGREIPGVSLDDPAYRQYQHWADRRMEGLIQRMQTRLKSIKPNLGLVTWTTNAGRYGHLRDIPRNMPARMNLLLDAPDQELWMEESNRGLSVLPAFACAYIWAVTNHRIAFTEPYLMSHGNPYGKDSFPAHEIERRMMLALTHGAGPSIAVAQPPRLREHVYRCLEEVQRRKPWLTHKTPEPWGALVMSDNTRVFYGRSAGLVEERYLAHVLGFFRAILEEHLPVTLLNDWNLTDQDLAPYKVLILANTASLDETQAGAIRRFVENGGGVVASVDASLCDAFGDARAEPVLADVFGVAYQGVPSAAADPAQALDVNFAKNLPPEYWEKRKNTWDFLAVDPAFFDAPRWSEYVGDERVTFKGQAAAVTLRGPEAKTVATLEPKSGGQNLPFPAVVVNRFGKGRSVYLAAGLDAAYYLYPYPYQRLALRKAIEWAAEAPPPVTVDAPMCVQAVSMRQVKDGQRVVVHLYNNLNTTATHALAGDDVPLREETVPIHDLKITFRHPRLGRIHLEPSGADLPPRRTDQGWEITVPRLEIHAMVVAELE